MEAAFATPTAGPEEPLELAAPLEEQVAAIEAAVTAEAAPEPVEEIEAVVAETQADEMAALEADPLPEWRTIDIEELPAEEIVPALDLAEVEEPEVEEVQIEHEPAPIAATAEAPPEPTPGEAAEAPVEEADIAAPDTVEPVEQAAEAEAEEMAPALESHQAGEMQDELVAEAPKAKRTKKAAAKPKPKKKASPAKRKPAKKAASLEDGVWLSDAIVYSLSGAWTTAWTPPEDASAAERLELFREKAAAGEFVIWGCAEGSDAWEPIKPAYWKTALVEPLSFLMGRENVTTDPKASKAKNPVKYTALKVVQPDIEALWPPATEVARDAA